MLDIDHGHTPILKLAPSKPASPDDPTPAMISAGITAAQDAAEAEGLTPGSIVRAIYLAMSAARLKG